MEVIESDSINLSLLYVDDEDALLDIGKIYLEKDAGIELVTANGAVHGIDLLKQNSFDCIISDYQMPVMDGIDFLKHLRSQGNNTPFIIFTGRGREEVVIEAINNGADFYVQKGGEPKSQFTELLYKVRRAVSAKKAGEELIKSEKKYRTLVENSTNFIYSCDLDNCFKTANRALYEFLGLSEGDIVGKKYEEVGFPDETCRLLYKLHKKVFDTADVVRSEFAIEMPDKNTYHFKVTLIPVIDDYGSVTGIRGDSADITDKVKAERELTDKNHSLLSLNEDLCAAEEEIRQQFDEIAKSHHILIETNQYLENLFNNSASLVLVWDNNFRITKANSAVEALTGLHGGRLNGLLLDELINSDLRAELSDKLMLLDQNEHIRGFETRIQTICGDLRTIKWDIAKIYDYSGKHISTTAQGHDITDILEYQNSILEKNERLLVANEEITAAEEELRQQMDEIVTAQHTIIEKNQYMKNLFNNSASPVMVFDSNFRITKANKAVESLTGISEDELKNLHFGDIISSDMKDKFTSKINEKAEWKYINGFEIPVMSASGEIRTILWNLSKIYDFSGKHISTTAQGHDITDILEYQNSILDKNEKLNLKNAELAAVEEELRQAHHQLKLLTGITRHDILNSIMAAEGYLELIEFSGNIDQGGYLNKLNGMIDKIRRQIEYTRASDTLCSNATWQNLYDTMNCMEAKSGISIDVSGLNAEILADPLLKKVFENLFDNTLRHGGDNISRIKAYCELSDDGELCITWEDDGTGIPDSEKEKIFDRGYGKNTGLGLSFVRDVLGLSGIKIRESGRPGEGAKFVISVPSGKYRIMNPVAE